jgi:3-oxoacyl-[acyl-carrier protein] reductase
MELKDAAALVTGAGRGIGRAVALALAREGVAVIGLARTAADLDSLVSEIEADGGRGLAVAGDVCDPTVPEAAVAATVEHFGGLQILVNNAGVGVFANVADTTDEDWDRVMATNVTAVFRLTRAALPHLAHRGGHVFMISSLAGVNPIAGMAAYCASKAALDHFAASLMLEVRHKGPCRRHLVDAQRRRPGAGRRRPAQDARRGPHQPRGAAPRPPPEALRVLPGSLSGSPAGFAAAPRLALRSAPLVRRSW